MSISYSDGGIPQEHGHKTKTGNSWEKAHFKGNRRATEASLQLCEQEVIKDLGEIYAPLL